MPEDPTPRTRPPTGAGSTPPPAPTRHQALAHPRRVRLLELLSAHPDGLDAAALAATTDLHANTVRIHLDKLVAAGLARAETVRAGTRGRPPTRYVAVEEDADGERYRLLSSMLATALATDDPTTPAPAAETAGQRWGRHLVAAARDRKATPPRPTAEEVTALMDELGFAPAREGDRIVLHACPYRDLARQRPDVICGLHLGLLRGAVDGDAAAEEAWLQPFVTPTRCEAGLSRPAADLDA